MNLSGVGVWSSHLRYRDQSEAAEKAAEVEELGYSALWIPDVGGPVFESVENLLKSTKHIAVATGVLNLWMHPPNDVAARCASVKSSYADRFLLGIGVSHGPVVNSVKPGQYKKPLTATADYLDGLDNASSPVAVTDRVLAALGPKMLQLAAERSAGTHPYLVTPEHTATARETLGEEALVLPEQTVIVCDGREEARRIGMEWLQAYQSLPNYVNNFARCGFSREDVSTVTDRFFDAIFAWGEEEAILSRINDHRSAGADHVYRPSRLAVSLVTESSIDLVWVRQSVDRGVQVCHVRPVPVGLG
ncbi:MAG: TIGR03620 family F420-dependent LLM class oxidoreductase [Mycobacterium sp.]|uniref:TIGR03620 family F420-dependent LLM class oxidoreductase n=1 Tax=Mycobacterium sp. TaxID=1785 RepID=UPI003CC6635C